MFPGLREIGGGPGGLAIPALGRSEMKPLTATRRVAAGGVVAVGVLSDGQIRKLIKIDPWADAIKRPGKVSYGVSSYGYDVRVGTHFKIFTATPRTAASRSWTPRSSPTT